VQTIHRTAHRTEYCSSRRRQSFQQLNLATLRAGNLLSIMSVFFGLAAALVPGSLEQRMGSFLFFGLIPAAAFHVGAIVFGGILAFSSELCEVIAVSSFRWLARLVKKYLILASRCLSYPSARYLMLPARTAVSTMSTLNTSACCSLRRGYRHANRVIFQFSCLLIRSGARFILRMQPRGNMRRR
jgi:hypothetical protein